MAGRAVRYVILVALVTLITCGAYGAGFGSGYYVRGRVSGECPPPLVECPPTSKVMPTPTYARGTSGGATPTPEEEAAFQVFWEAWAAVKEEYYGELPPTDKLVDGAIRGMVQVLGDKFTSYISPEIARVINEDATGSFEGIGAMVRMNENNQLEISRPFPGQPADKAGVRAGDIVLAVDGTSIAGYGLYEAIALIRGPAGSKVTLTIERAGEDKPFDVTITRARIEIPIIESKMLPDNIAYVKLDEFSAPATERLQAALKDLLAQKPKGLILDLRDNPGGFLQQAIEVSDQFLASGIIVIERMGEGEEKTFRATSRGIAQDIPMVVLVNGGSASASEIVAGALQDLGRAKLIGEQTFGKGSVQTSRTLSNNGEMRVTIARWFTPNDRAIHGEGLKPDIEVELTADDAKAGRDPQLDRAVEYLLTGK